MKKKIIFLALVVAIATLIYHFFKARISYDNGKYITTYGNVDTRDVKLGFRVLGRLATLNYEEGDRVQKGAILAILDQKPFQDSLQLREAELKSSIAISYNAEKLYKRSAELITSGTISKEKYDDSLASFDEAMANLEAAKVRVAQATTDLQDTEILSPDDGVIITRVLEPGSIVAIGAPVYTLVLDKPVWVRTYVDEENLGHVYPGQKAIIITDSGNKYEGQVGFISPQAEFTPKNVETTQLRTDLVYRLRVIVDNTDNTLRQGMPVTVHIIRKAK